METVPFNAGKVSPIGINPHGTFDRPTLDQPVSPLFRARSTDAKYLSECTGVCNCQSVFGDGIVLTTEQRQAVVPKILALDVDTVKYKLMNPDAGEGMTREQADATEKWYKRFLILVIENPGRHIVPHKMIDRFWHTHILDTRKYGDDCQRLFGATLHHFPFFGMRDDNDFAHLEAAGNETRDLYVERFGQTLHDLTRHFTN